MRYTSKQIAMIPEIIYKIFMLSLHQTLADEYQPKGYQEEYYEQDERNKVIH